MRVINVSRQVDARVTDIAASQSVAFLVDYR